MFSEQQNTSIAQTELNTIFRQNYEMTTPPNYATAMTEEIFKVIDTTHAAYIGKVHKGPGLFSKIGETTTVPAYVAKVANKYTISVSDFAEGISISKNLFDDDLHGEWNSQVAEFAIMARRTQDFNSFRLFRGGFTTTLTADGSAWFSTHTLLGGGTTSNRILTADITGAASTALTTASLNVAQRRLASMKSHANVPLQCVGNILLVPTALYITSRQVVGSALIPENGNNAINALSMDYSIKVYQSVFLGTESPDGLGSDTAWFLLDSSRHAIRRLVRQGVQTNLRDWGMSNDRTYYYQANFREEVFVPDYVGAVGATGDNA